MDTATITDTKGATTEREGLLAVFKELRTKHSFIAKSNYMCCSGCVLADLFDKAKAPSSRRKKYFTFWTKQDNEAFDAYGFQRLYRKEIWGIYLNYGVMEEPASDAATIEAGNIMVKVLKEHGFDVEWSGKPSSCILVKGWANFPADWKRIHSLR